MTSTAPLPAPVRPAPVRPAPVRPASGRLPGLELLRFVAALCVLLLHVRAVFGGQQVFGRGYLGVDFFLMLSGFLMVRVQEPRLATGMAVGGFLRARIWRLWPMMTAAWAIGLPMQWLRAHGPWDFAWVAVANLALVPVLGHTFLFPVNIPAWTILYELGCNTAHVLALRRLRGPWLAVLLLVLAMGEIWVCRHYLGLNVGPRPDTALAGIVRCLFAYGLGIALARAIATCQRSLLPGWCGWLAVPAMPAILALSWAAGVRVWWFDLGFVAIACPLMLLGALGLTRLGRTAGWLGRFAFPVFALQMPILQGSQHLGAGYWSGLALAIAGGVLGVLVPLAWRRIRTVM
jgi:peptidoglycan/LPS O-acetylase OafA/YrhL